MGGCIKRFSYIERSAWAFMWHGDYEKRLVWIIIYSCHMAAFFVVSGCVDIKGKYQILSLWGNACQLLFPFIL